jgi:hypothetical protein
MNRLHGLKTSHLLKLIGPFHRILLMQPGSQGRDEVDRRDFEEGEPSQEGEERCSSLDEMKQAIHFVVEEELVEEELALYMYYHQTLDIKGGYFQSF